MPTQGTPTSSPLDALRARLRQQDGAVLENMPLDPAGSAQPFALTDMQQAYWLGRRPDLDGGGVAMQITLEFEAPTLDREGLERSFNQLVERHPMLRAQVTRDGRQQVIEPPPHFSIEHQDLSALDAASAATERLHSRNALIAEQVPLEQWPQSRIRVLSLADRQVLQVKLDMWAVDGRSFQILLEEWAALYHDQHATLRPLEAQFRDYVMELERRLQRPAHLASLQYWRERLPSLPPPPALPGNPRVDDGEPVFSRRAHTLSVADTEALRQHCREAGLSLASVLATAFALVLARWQPARHFVLNVPRFNRPDWHPDLAHVVGEFASFSLLEVALSPAATFQQQARQIQQRMWDDLAHDSVSGVRLLREWGQGQGLAAANAPIVFTTMPEKRPGAGTALDAAFKTFGDLVFTRSATPQVHLDCQYFELDRALLVNWDSVDSRFAPGLMDAMFPAFVELVQALAQDAGRWQDTAPVRVPAAQQRLHAASNATDEVFADPDLLTRLFQQARQQPQHPAALYGTQQLGYAELVAQAGLLASRLHSLAAPPGHPRTLLLWCRNPLQRLVSCVAAWLANAAFIPVDLDSPPERLKQLLQTARPMAVIADHPLPTDAVACPVIDPAETSATPGAALLHTQPRRPDAPAYVIFTSGSTGLPKGVAVGHAALENCVSASLRRFNLGPGDRIAAVTAAHHDLSVFDIAGGLAAGTTLVFCAGVASPTAWAELARQHGITFWNSVPLYMTALLDAVEAGQATFPPSLRQVVLGGDWVPVSLPARLWAQAPQAELTTIGGPTETTIWNIMNRVTPADTLGASLPYGRPLANCRYYILDDQGQPCPTLATGQLYCAGLCLADGYLNDPQRTAAAFTDIAASGERCYATGDLGRWLPDGRIEFVGRVDFQLNLGGYRLDPGEVESVARRHPAITHAALVVHAGTDAQPPQRVLFYTHAAAIQQDELLAHLRQYLPATALPQRLQPLTSLPLSSNGKLDRQRLAGWPLTQVAAAQSRAPSTELELFLAALWQSLLQQPVTSLQCNFFELGGDSLQAMRLLTRLEDELALRLPLAVLFRHPTLAGFTDAVLDQLAALMPAEGTAHA